MSHSCQCGEQKVGIGECGIHTAFILHGSLGVIAREPGSPHSGLTVPLDRLYLLKYMWFIELVK